MKTYNVALVGATGAVGSEMLKILAERKFPIGELRLLATERSKGTVIQFEGKDYVVDATTKDSFENIDIVLFAGGIASKMYAEDAVKAGAVCIDNSSNFRYDPEVPLVIPEVNPEDVEWHKGIIANPNCTTIIALVALKPLHDAARITRLICSSYQAVSGAGQPGLHELEDQVKRIANGQPIDPPSAFAHQIAFNVIPHIDKLQDNGYYKEEMKMVWETQKMFHDDQIRVAATCVRVPVYRSHSESLTIETERPLSPDEAREVLRHAPGVTVVDDPGAGVYPMPLDTSDQDNVFVGRIREDISCSGNGLNLWVCGDQIRKGAATNTVQIAELLIKKGLI